MQRDLDRLQRHKRQRRRVLLVVVVAMMLALTMAGIRSCSDQFNEPYNKEYRPMDTPQ